MHSGCKTGKQTAPKVKLLYELESRISNDMPPNVDATVIDAMFFLHLQKAIPGTFGALSSYLSTQICSEKGNELHMVFDKVQSPSIKDCERDERSENVSRESNYQITGPGQHTPSYWLETLRNDNFKVSLNKFLVNIWKNDCFDGILKEKKLYVTDGNVCYLCEVSNGKMVRMIQAHLYSIHEEANSKMIFHVTSIEENSNVVIRTADTDVLIIALVVLAKYHHRVTYGLKLGCLQKTLCDTLMITSCKEKLVIQFLNLFQLTILLQVATIPLLFLGKGKSAPLNTSKRMNLCKKYLVAWVSMRK